MSHDLGEVVRVDGVEYVEKVRSWGALALWILVWEELHHFRILGELWVQGLHAELFILRHLDLLYLLLLQ